MKNWSGFTNFSSLFPKLLIVFLCIITTVSAQNRDGNGSGSENENKRSNTSTVEDNQTDEQNIMPDSLPAPKSVMLKSAMVPGWGQVVNEQVWKVPIVYGMLGTLVWNSVRLTKRFHDFRAAAFNAQVEGTDMDDMRFGPTPEFLQGDFSERFLRSRRDELRNNRDLMFIIIGVAYGLNVLDAYVFAHMKTFNVSDDLSLNTSISPSMVEGNNPGFTLSISLTKRTK